jgi:1-acyl-sn-glycerol-3-phosphate acyltransferase
VDAPAISTWILFCFRRIVRGYFRRHFHGVRTIGAERFVHDGSPLIVYANHSSWWDPMVSILLADRLMHQRKHYAPMDAAALERYAIFKKLGIFPVDTKSPRGAAQFLRAGRAILDAGGVLWVTPQGKFVDPRERPLQFKPGLAALASRVATASGTCVVFPMAIEYTFWDERLPECLLRFGEPVRVAAGDAPEEIELRLKQALLVTMDALKEAALCRDASHFQVLAAGTAGTGGFYSIGLRIEAFLRGKKYRPEHTPAGTAAPAVVVTPVREGSVKG